MPAVRHAVHVHVLRLHRRCRCRGRLRPPVGSRPCCASPLPQHEEPRALQEPRSRRVCARSCLGIGSGCHPAGRAHRRWVKPRPLGCGRGCRCGARVCPRLPPTGQQDVPAVSSGGLCAFVLRESAATRSEEQGLHARERGGPTSLPDPPATGWRGDCATGDWFDRASSPSRPSISLFRYSATRDRGTAPPLYAPCCSWESETSQQSIFSIDARCPAAYARRWSWPAVGKGERDTACPVTLKQATFWECAHRTQSNTEFHCYSSRWSPHTWGRRL